MKTKLNQMVTVGLMMLAVAGLVLILFPGQSHAAVVCPTTSTGDFDADGLTDQEECNGIILPDRITVVPLCTGSMERASCLDPNTKDLFVILAKVATNSLIDRYLENLSPQIDPLAFLRGSLATGGLGITIHRLLPSQAGPNREVTATQHAVSVAEILDVSDIPTGSCSQGTPNGLDRCAVFTQRIVNLVNSLCTAVKTVCDVNPGTGNNPAGVIATYIQDTIAHESSHSLNLRAIYDSRFGGNHYKTGTNVVMDQSVYYTDKGGKVTFFIPGVYASVDPSDARLK